MHRLQGEGKGGGVQIPLPSISYGKFKYVKLPGTETMKHGKPSPGKFFLDLHDHVMCTDHALLKLCISMCTSILQIQSMNYQNQLL